MYIKLSMRLLGLVQGNRYLYREVTQELKCNRRSNSAVQQSQRSPSRFVRHALSSFFFQNTTTQNTKDTDDARKEGYEAQNKLIVSWHDRRIALDLMDGLVK